MKDVEVYPNFNYSFNAKKLLGTEDKDIDVILKHYNISHETLDEMVKNIREWYEKQPHLPQGQLHDRMIISHLCTRAFSVEQAKDNIDNYFEARHRMPDILCGWDPIPPNIAKCINQGYWIIIPKKTIDNQRLIFLRLVEPKDMVVFDVIKVVFAIREYRLFNDTSVAENWIFDFSNATLNAALQVTPVLLSKLYYNITSCYAPKLKGIHFINVPTFAVSILNLFKKIIKPKHAERMHLHDSIEKVFDYYPRDLFPKDIGGSADYTCQDITDNWSEFFKSEPWSNYLRHSEKHFYTDESKRVTPSKIGDLLGIQGSFRKLDLD